MRVSAARPEAAQVVAVRRWPLGCVMRKRRVSVRSYCTRDISTHHTQGPRNRHGWIGQATCFLLRRRRAQAFVRFNQQVSSYVFLIPFFFFQKQRDVLLMTRFRRWGVVSFADSLDCVGIVGKDVTTASKVFGSLLQVPFYQEFLYLCKASTRRSLCL